MMQTHSHDKAYPEQNVSSPQRINQKGREELSTREESSDLSLGERPETATTDQTMDQLTIRAVKYAR